MFLDMKALLKIGVYVIVLCLIFAGVSCVLGSLRISQVLASGATQNPIFSLSPNAGFTGVGDDFWIKVMLNTDNAESLSSRAVVLFDPEYMELTKVEHGNIYCDYPAEDQSTYGSSNTDGYIVITGYCDDPYGQTTTSEVFATLYFTALKVGDTTIAFRYNGKDENGQTVVYATGSPPTNILNTAPAGGSYKIVTDADAYTGPSTFAIGETWWIFPVIATVSIGIIGVIWQVVERKIFKKA